MKTKQQLINSLIYRYQGILKEVIAQQLLFPSQLEYTCMVIKIQGYINTIQGIYLKTINK
jgi:hypothetical protein